MLSEVLPATKPDLDSPASHDDLSPTPTNIQVSPQPNGNSPSQLPPTSTTGDFPPPKTDKPRPHVCTTCGRSFARLEHLKRHERSHTKEKPFECPECTRCFARRDLLLRHQQKLHMTNATARQRNGRRESVSSNAPAALGPRGRKQSVASSVVSSNGTIPGSGARPRANTLSHLDIPPFGHLDGTDGGLSRVHTHNLVFSPHSGMMHPASGAMDYNYHGIPHMVDPHGNMHGLSKLDTQVSSLDMTNAMHTAPPFAHGPGFVDADGLNVAPSHSTINPAALHFGNGGPGATASIPFGYSISVNQQGAVPEVDDLGWMNHWNGSGHDLGDQAIDESSPSRMSSGDSPETYDESLNNSHMGIPMTNGFGWHPEAQMQQQQHQQQQQSLHPFQMDPMAPAMSNPEMAGSLLSSHMMHDVSPNTDAFQRTMLHNGNGQMHQHQQPPPKMQQDMFATQSAPLVNYPLSHLSSNSPSVASSSMTGSARQSSVTSVTTDSITDSTRQALLVSLSQASGLSNGHRSAPPPSLSPGSSRPAQPSNSPQLPSTDDLRRYLDAFIQFALPHLPVVHLPTLAFDTFAKGFESCFASRGSGQASAFNPHAPASGSVGGARCLILGMAAVGALYEYDHAASKDLFEAAKKLISLYLEERRKADMCAAVNGSSESSEPPLWLVQAMLLTVIYGHHCGDKLTADIASNQIAALVSLSRAAKLNRSHSAQASSAEDMDMTDDADGDQHSNDELQMQWLRWKKQEERKRLFFAIFTISSLLTLAYNHTPCIMNSEIHLDLPCQEPLWNAETAQEWQELGGQALVDQTAIPFASALSTLLTANKRHPQKKDAPQSAFNLSNPLAALQTSADDVECELKPSTFGCYVLIHALHNYIWETRSRHRGKEWTAQETEVMVSHIEPALKVWQAAWKATNYHKLERPNPFGLGPMAADSIPLLDLAFVKLFVNLSRTAEAFWRRDFETMAEELSKGGEVILAGTPSERKNPFDAHRRGSGANGCGMDASLSHAAASVRERSLRKAALYAADSMAISCTFNLTYADVAAHELPIQSAICFLDCAQVLSEWCTTVQERVGRFLGVLGRDAIDFTQVPAMMLLAAEDVELLHKIEQICNNLENKRHQQDSLLAINMQNLDPSALHHPNGNESAELAACGIGSRVLRVTAMMLEKAVIWPITHVMANALETQATHMDCRATASVTTAAR